MSEPYYANLITYAYDGGTYGQWEVCGPGCLCVSATDREGAEILAARLNSQEAEIFHLREKLAAAEHELRGLRYL